MKVYKKIILGFLAIWIICIAWIYLTSTRITYIIPKGYEGPLLIIANQPNGININQHNIIYDFTKSNIILIKNSLDTGFTPLGYTKYYFYNKGNKIPIDITDDVKKNSNDKNLYIWDNYYQIGGCEVKHNVKISYEIIVLSKSINLNKVLDERDSLIQYNICAVK